MKHLSIPKIGFGILLTLVLAFSVLGTAEALTFRESRTGDLQTIITGNEFTVSFSVTLGSNTTRITKKGKLIKDSVELGAPFDNFTDADHRIDSSGYLVFDATNGTAYRLMDADTTLQNTYARTGTNQAWESTGDGTLYVSGGSATSNGSVVNEDGAAVYTRTGDNAPYTYTRAMAKTRPKVDDENRYHYNQEAISIDVPENLTLIKVGNHRVNITHGVLGDPHLMNEATGVDATKLTSSIRLTFRAGAVGERTITITDTTPPADRPDTDTRRLSFTIFVVKALETATNVALTTPTQDYTTGNDNADSQVDTLFSFSGGSNAEDAPIIYKVEGSGRLYVEETYTGNAAGSPTSKSPSTQTLSTSAQATVKLDMNGSSNKVTAYPRDQNPAEKGRTIAFIFQYAQIEIIGGNNKTGVPNARLIDPLHIRVKDAKGRALSGLAVTFTPANGGTLQPVLGTDVYLEQNNSWANAFNEIVRTKAATSTVPPITGDEAIGENGAAMVPTNQSGEAQVYLKLGTAGNKTVTVSAGGDTDTFYATSSTSTDIPSLEIFSGNNQKSASDGKVADPLVVRVLASNSSPLPVKTVTFTTTKGYLRTTAGYELSESPVNGPATQVKAQTDVNGKASVGYDLVNHSGTADVIAVIRSATTSTSPYERRVTFNINGTGSTTPPATQQPTQQPTTTPTTFTVSPSTITGAPGSTQTLTITGPTTAQLTIGGLDFSVAGGTVSPSSGTGSLTSTLTLPSTVGTYTLTVNDGGTTVQTVSVNVTTATTTPTQTTGALSISLPFSGAPGSTQTATITATGSDGNLASGVVVTLAVTNGGGTFSPTSVTTGTEGTAVSVLTRGSTIGTNYFVTANARGYTEARTRISIGTGSTPPTTTTPTTPTTGTTPTVSGSASSITINGQATRTGTVNQQLAAPLVVEVLDSNSRSVADARVIFRVRSGQGRLSQRGNGRAIAVETDSRGYARATYTPMSASSTVVASVGGVSEAVTFTITTGAAPATSTPGTGTSTTTPIEPKVLVAAANRPAMYWIDSGMLYGLTGTEAVKIADAVNGAAVGGGKVYWTEQTGNSAGTINAANLDGSGVKQLTSILAVPMGIAVDTGDQKLYWTNSRGRIQSANLDGSGIRNVRQNLSDPTDIALSDTHIYWVASGDTIRRVNMTGTRVVQDVAVGLMDVGGIAVGGGKVYWTEKTGGSAGTITGANLDGTQFKTLATIQAVPMGIAVDTTDQKLYWTNSRGRVQRANLNGSKIQNVVDGLGSPSHIAIGGASQGTTATKPATQPTETQKPKKDTAKYDVNGDGTVDNVDASLVSGAMGTNTATYDVNGDGTVNFLDLLLVFDNRDDDAAGAPTVLGMKLTAVQIDVIEEQIDLLIATGDRSPSAMRTLVYLQQLIATARPEKTQLLANYPNPFNPETWIPYELADATKVKITIYNTQGVAIRTLDLGHQSAGYYTGRDRAAYWDGRNALGEQVASGLYFYQFETDTMSAMRKMVILK